MAFTRGKAETLDALLEKHRRNRVLIFTANNETALGPTIDLLQAPGVPLLTFWCNNLSEEGTCTIHERREHRRLIVITATGGGHQSGEHDGGSG